MAELVIDNPYTLEEAVRRPWAAKAEVDRLLAGAARAALDFGLLRPSSRQAIFFKL